ncbi:MAG: double-strand break repair protein AddB, partial [Rhodospirillaceae bacterium]|nr:double-strand break repair protein AddB [Rhodospirillaceae bacterium]
MSARRTASSGSAGSTPISRPISHRARPPHRRPRPTCSTPADRAMTGTGTRAADGGPARSVYTIPPQRDFVTALARGLLDRFGDAPESLAPVLVLLPTRRACRTLREAFLRLSGGAPLLLPRMRPIGDVDEDDLALSAGEDLPPEDGALFETPPAIPELKRQLMLARLILERERDASAEQAVLLAQALARLLDQAQTERLSFDRLAELAPEELSVHWQESLDFLKIVTEAWPAVLEENAAMDPAARRNLLLERLERRWAQAAPDHPVIAAGSTGSIPATADLLATVAALPDGQVVLPGLDRHLDEESWSAVEADEGHPQFGLARLLQRLDIRREDVQDWPEPAAADSVRCEATPARVRLVAEALRPAGTTEAWARRPLDGDMLAAALGPDLGRVVCRDPGEEARVVALAFRRTLDTPGKTATLVTPDRDLGRRVAAEMQRWGVSVDDSAGVPLAATPPASFLLLLARAVEDGLAPTGLLALLKHPLCAAGQDTADTRRQARALERAALRGPRPDAGIEGLRRRIAAVRGDRFGPGAAVCDEAAALVERLDDLLAPLLVEKPRAMPDYLRALCSAAATLAATPDDPAGRRLWAGDAGEALAGFIDELADAGAVVAPAALHDRASLLATLMFGRVVRPRYGAHPRLAIQGPLEARLHHADLTILGGLNEGAWPPEAPVDPWMSRPMRLQFGLPSPERRTGLSAHDFAQAFCAPDVLVTRSEKVDGSPAVASRWLQRLDTVLEGALDAQTLEGIRNRDGALVTLARQLDRPTRVESCARPQPRPPVAARPRRLSVTQIERWLRDPYTIYARHILRLTPLDEIDADPGALERGIILHDVFEAFVRDHPAGPLPPDALPKLLALGRARFMDLAHAPGVAALWWPRFERAAEAFVAREAVRRPAIRSSHV